MLLLMCNKLSKIETVLGPISPDKLGTTLMHEHVFVDLATVWLKRRAEEIRTIHGSKLTYIDKKVSIEILGKLRRGDIICKDDMIISDENLVSEELAEYKKWGGVSIVDQGMPGLGRDVLGLKRMANLLGLNIIAVTGFYNHHSHPSYVKKMSVEDLKNHFIKELTEGIEGTPIKAGGIGEVANTEPVPHHPEEKKVLEASFLAQTEVGCSFTLHPSKIDSPRKKMVTYGELYLDMLDKAGANINKFYLSHADWFTWDMKYLRRLLDRGATLLFDTFGMESYSGPPYFPRNRTPNDVERVTAIFELCEAGYDKQLVVGHDMAHKHMLKRYGGYGFSHILEHIVPELLEWGTSQKQIDNMLINNPRNLLAY